MIKFPVMPLPPPPPSQQMLELMQMIDDAISDIIKVSTGHLTSTDVAVGKAAHRITMNADGSLEFHREAPWQ